MRGFPAAAQRTLARDLARLLARYAFLLDASLVEFFTDALWGGLPPAWQAALANLPPPQLADLLLLEHRSPAGPGRGAAPAAVAAPSFPSVWPLSLLAFRAAAHALAFPRRRRRPSAPAEAPSPPALSPIFRKHVKPKKQHEIQQLAQLVKKLSDITGCHHVVDVGSGQGHLSRFLAFGCHLAVTAVEEDPRLVDQAIKFDQELRRALRKEQAKGIQVFMEPATHNVENKRPQSKPGPNKLNKTYKPESFNITKANQVAQNCMVWKERDEKKASSPGGTW